VTDTDDDADLEAAEQALAEGRSAEVLERLAQRSDPSAAERALRVLARLDLGDVAGARRDLDEAGTQSSVDLDHARAEVLLLEWRLDEARALFESLQREVPDPSFCERLALLADVRGDSAESDKWMSAAGSLDPEHAPPFRLGEAEFLRCVEAAAELLPPELRADLERTSVVVLPAPSPDDVDRADPAGTPPDMLGLFVGASDLELADAGEDFVPTPVIHLYQRNLERACADRATLVEEIRVTLWHEFGHKLGFDEDGVDELGLG